MIRGVRHQYFPFYNVYVHVHVLYFKSGLASSGGDVFVFHSNNVLEQAERDINQYDIMSEAKEWAGKCGEMGACFRSGLESDNIPLPPHTFKVCVYVCVYAMV